MMASLFAGVSGLRNHQVKMNVVGDNIANVNTIGFKMGRVTFQEALVQTMRGASRPTANKGGSNPLQLGLGMSLATIDNIFLQGGLETTGQITDLAIQGSGFFVLSNGLQEYYTRAGAFGYDANSNMVNPSNGFILQGKMADVDGTIPANAPVGNIALPFGQQDPARATAQMTMGMNLDSNATDSLASLFQAGNSNVTTVSGYAQNGSGGTHTITITGENATFSQLSGNHANELDDLGLGDATATSNLDGAGNLLPGTTYYYTVIAMNELGQSTGVEFGHTLAAGNDSIVIDWLGYPDLADADKINIYRTTVAGDYTQGDNGWIAEIDISGTAPPASYTDLGDTPISNVNPPAINSTVNLTGQVKLSDLGIVNATNFQISVDNDDWVTLTQLTVNSTINDLISAINSSVQGVTASIVDGQIQLKRDYAGSPSVCNARVRDLAYPNQLDDFGVGNATATSNLDGSGSLIPGTAYYYTVIAVNSIGESIGVEFNQTVAAGDDSMVIDWSAYADLTDATSVRIYRTIVPGDYTSGNNGLIAEIDVTGGTTTYTDLGVAPLSNENPPTANTTIPDICLKIFGTSTFTVNNGTASTIQAVDVFTPNVTGIAFDPVTLTLVTDPNTGIVTGISDLGGGGVTISTGQSGLVGDPDGTGPLTSSTLIIETRDTQHATSITTYDSQGGKHTITITFTKSWENNMWYWEASVSGNEVIRTGGSGTVNFSADGSLASFNFDGGATSLRIDPNNGAEEMDIAILAGTPGGFDGLTGFAASSTATARSQDGYGLGVLANISIDSSGTITGIFTNGVSRVLAQIYIADFNNPAGLIKMGKNLYQTSANSGNAILGIPGSTTSSAITSGALEISNVDLAQEFTNMIVAQRGFQANARVITTSDSMLQELVNLKG